MLPGILKSTVVHHTRVWLLPTLLRFSPIFLCLGMKFIDGSTYCLQVLELRGEVPGALCARR